MTLEEIFFTFYTSYVHVDDNEEGDEDKDDKVGDADCWVSTVAFSFDWVVDALFMRVTYFEIKAILI